MLLGICPRCGETEIYFANRETMTGIGGVWGNRTKNVTRAICKDCGEVATPLPREGEISHQDYANLMILWVAGLVVVGLVILTISFAYSAIVSA
jgi:hypothetical protein